MALKLLVELTSFLQQKKRKVSFGFALPFAETTGPWVMDSIIPQLHMTVTGRTWISDTRTLGQSVWCSWSEVGIQALVFFQISPGLKSSDVSESAQRDSRVARKPNLPLSLPIVDSSGLAGICFY